MTTRFKMADLEPGTELHGYRIEGVAGRGGLSVVYRAVHAGTGQTVALKLLRPELEDDEELRERIRNEATVASSLDHPHVIPIHEAGPSFIAMQFVDGSDLKELAPLEPTRAARMVAQAAEGLGALHARGLVHRDVKPGNVLVEGDHAYLTDFGLAREQPALETAGRWYGTVDYAAPEQIRAQALDARTDVYALGGVLCWALTATVPFPRDDDDAKMRAHLEDTPSLPAFPELEAVVRRAMAKRPEERFESAAALARALSE
jgi:serine/threonine-protein kinase